MTKKCPYCNSNVNDQALYCSYCGNQLITKEDAKRLLKEYESSPTITRGGNYRSITRGINHDPYSTINRDGSFTVADLYRIIGDKQQSQVLYRQQIDEMVSELSEHIDDIDEDTLCILGDYYYHQDDKDIAYELYLIASDRGSDYAKEQIDKLNSELNH